MAHTDVSTQALGSEAFTSNAAIATALPDLCTVQARTSTPDGSGGQSYSYSTAGTNVRCRIKDVQQMTKRVAGGKVLTTVKAIGEFNLEAPITSTSRILVNGDIWDVLGIDDGASSAVLLTAELIKR